MGHYSGSHGPSGAALCGGHYLGSEINTAVQKMVLRKVQYTVQNLGHWREIWWPFFMCDFGVFLRPCHHEIF